MLGELGDTSARRSDSRLGHAIGPLKRPRTRDARYKSRTPDSAQPAKTTRLLRFSPQCRHRWPFVNQPSAHRQARRIRRDERPRLPTADTPRPQLVRKKTKRTRNPRRQANGFAVPPRREVRLQIQVPQPWLRKLCQRRCKFTTDSQHRPRADCCGRQNARFPHTTRWSCTRPSEPPSCSRQWDNFLPSKDTAR